MQGNSDAGSRYLSLALLTRGAMNNLKCVSQGDPVGESLNATLVHLLAGLHSQPTGNFLAQLQAGNAASSFEELATLSTLYAEFESTNVAQNFSDVMENDDAAIRGASAKRLINFLGAVESKALHYYSRAIQQPSY